VCQITQFITDHNLGDLASVIGLVIVVVGFVFTIIGVTRSRRAAQKAEEATRAAIGEMLRSNTIADVSAAISTMSEIKRVHRLSEPQWHLLPDRYSQIRRMLIAIPTSHGNLSNADLSAVQASIAQFRAIERRVEAFLSTAKPEPNWAKLNVIVSDQVDKLSVILAAMKQRPQ